jgi:hypothetical protein
LTNPGSCSPPPSEKLQVRARKFFPSPLRHMKAGGREGIRPCPPSPRARRSPPALPLSLPPSFPPSLPPFPHP